MDKRHLIIGSLLSGLAVAIGAFGAHALKNILESNGRIQTFETAVQYHMFHALGILLLGILMSRKPHKSLQWVSYLFLLGIIVFSGSLYTMSITGITSLGMITPIGGIMFISGWTLLTIYLIRNY